MPRRNGSFLGFTASPTPSAASGIWRVREAEEFLRANKWPATPGVPGSPSAIAGNTQVSLSWSAPALGSPPTDYQVQYSNDAGATWTTFADGTSAATSATVTGLTNGTGYVFRVRAVNALGEGPYGSTSAVVTPAALDVALLLRFDGANGADNFPDSSPSNIVVTGNNGAVISTAQSKWGGSSAYFDGADDYLRASLPFDWDADFTLEMWIYKTRGDDYYPTLLEAGDIQSGMGGLHMAIKPDGIISVSDGISSTVDGVTVPLNQWHHVALVRSGGANVLYQDGVGSPPVMFSFENHLQNNTISIGNAPNYAMAYEGYIDDLRLVRSAVYTSNFTPPTAPFA